MNTQTKRLIAQRSTPITEDATKYGEFIARFHKWPTSEYQMKRAEHLADVTSSNHSFS